MKKLNVRKTPVFSASHYVGTNNLALANIQRRPENGG